MRDSIVEYTRVDTEEGGVCINKVLEELMEIGEIYVNPHGLVYMIIDGERTAIFDSVKTLIDAKDCLVRRYKK